MKAVILLAGRGRRFQKTCKGVHKSLAMLKGRPLLEYLINGLQKAGITEIIPVLGYQGEAVLECIKSSCNEIIVHPVWNNEYEVSNNLASMLKAKKYVCEHDFIQLNGDMVFDLKLVSDMIAMEGAAISVDTQDYSEELDSPRVQIQEERILDLGRHIHMSEANGYAIGIYRFSKELARDFFICGEKMVNENPQFGFHEPLRMLFAEHIIKPILANGYLWMDVDEEKDIKKAQVYIKKLEEKYGTF